MNRWAFPLGLLLTVAVMVGVSRWRGQRSSEPPREIFDDMSVQPRYNAQARSAFFNDGRAMRRPVPGSVPFGGVDYAADAGSPTPQPDLLREDDAFYRGTVRVTGWLTDTNQFLKKMPLTPDEPLLARGKERYGIYCAVCHGPAGYGNGVTTKFGMLGVGNFHQDRIRQMPDGEIFHVIGQGKGTMQGYAAQVKPRDRWAIVAWVRVLQRSQNAKIDDVPAEHRRELEAMK